jgi:hypothetical protein
MGELIGSRITVVAETPADVTVLRFPPPQDRAVVEEKTAAQYQHVLSFVFLVGHSSINSRK